MGLGETTVGDYVHGQDDFQNKATSGIETDGRTDGDLEFGQDRFQLYQDEISTETKAMGWIESDARTGGYFGHGPDYFSSTRT